MFKRILGIVMILTAILGVLISIGIAIYGQEAITNTGNQVDAILELTTVNLDTAEETLVLAKTAIGDVNTTFETIEVTATDLSQTLADTQPLLDQIGQITTEDVPESLDAVEDALPSITAVAGTVDRTLRTLSGFGVEKDFGEIDLGPFGSFPLGSIDFDLGIDYDPDQPFDESVEALGTSIEGLPEQLRSLDTQLDTTSSNLDTLSDDIDQLAQDIDSLNTTIAEAPALIDQYLATITDIQDRVSETRLQVRNQFRTASTLVIVLAIWFGLLHLAPLYLGWELVMGNRVFVETEEIDAIPIIHEHDEHDPDDHDHHDDHDHDHHDHDDHDPHHDHV